jgi:hypothetical protein
MAIKYYSYGCNKEKKFKKTIMRRKNEKEDLFRIIRDVTGCRSHSIALNALAGNRRQNTGIRK